MESVDHPAHYGGDTPYEAIKVIEAWDLGFCLGNTVKYISRAGEKSPDTELEDLKKARWYLDREIATLEETQRVMAGEPENRELEWVEVSPGCYQIFYGGEPKSNVVPGD